MSTGYYFSNGQRNAQAAASAANPRTPARQNPAASLGRTPSYYHHQSAQEEAWRSMVESDPMAREIESLSVASRSSASSSSSSSPRR